MKAERIGAAREKILALSSPCRLCPRECGVRRDRGETGFCRTGTEPLIASICLHRGEEPVLSGRRGIGNVFFAHCTLQCRYCQNYQISANRDAGQTRPTSPQRAAADIAPLLRNGEGNLGLVSPTHQLPQVLEILETLWRGGFSPTLVYNTSGYERVEVLRALEGVIDVYLPDLKYLDPETAETWSGAGDYPARARETLREMFRQKGPDLEIDPGGIARAGLIVRHLVLPGQVADSLRCLNFLAEEFSNRLYLSLMAQYTPTPAVAGDPLLGRKLFSSEYDRVINGMESLGFSRGWVQRLESAGHYLPDFSREEAFG